MSLMAELEQIERLCDRRHKGNYLTSFALQIVSVSASAATTILVALKVGCVPVVASLAALPAIIVVTLRSIPLDARANWWAERRAKIQAFKRSIRDQNQSEPDVSVALSKYLETQDKRFPGARP